MRTLRPYQDRLVIGCAQALGRGLRKIIAQLATGGGKTVAMATIAYRFIQKSKGRVLISVHREELLAQTRRTLFDWYGINAAAITADTKRCPPADVYVAMVETIHRRMKNPLFLPDINLVITDECHIGNHRKVEELFPDAFIIGFTATPLSAKKKDPLKNYYDDIVCGVDIPELIAEGSLCQNHTYRIKGINRTSLKVSRGDFDEHQMADEYTKTKHIKNTLEGYEKYAKNTKTIIFNCNLHHSRLVCDNFIGAGYNCRHIDCTDEEARKDALLWLKRTPNAILCNVGILTTGFDEPSVETIIVNKATMSLTLWLQMTGRGARPFPGKEHFTIIDMGDNVGEHSDWCDSRDWYDLFHNPPKARDKKDVAPVKECPKCEAMIAVQARQCPYCEYIYPAKEEVYDTLPPEFERVVRHLDVESLIERNSHYKEYYTFFQIGNNIAANAKHRLGILSAEQAQQLQDLYFEKAKDWCLIKGKKFNQWHKDTASKHLLEQLAKQLAV